MTTLVDRLFVKYSSKFSALRRVPGLGAVTHRLSHRLLPPDRRVWVRVRKGVGQGLWLKLYPRTAQMFCDGELEPDLQEVLAKHLRPGMVFYDLGASVGLLSLLAARLVGAKGKVFSFEADPEVAERLKENVEELAGGFGADTPIFPCDVTRDEDISRVFESVQTTFGRLDVMLHSVAFAPKEAAATATTNRSRGRRRPRAR